MAKVVAGALCTLRSAPRSSSCTRSILRALLCTLRSAPVGRCTLLSCARYALRLVPLLCTARSPSLRAPTTLEATAQAAHAEAAYPIAPLLQGYIRTPLHPKLKTTYLHQRLPRSSIYLTTYVHHCAPRPRLHTCTNASLGEGALEHLSRWPVLQPISEACQFPAEVCQWQCVLRGRSPCSDKKRPWGDTPALTDNTGPTSRQRPYQMTPGPRPTDQANSSPAVCQCCSAVTVPDTLGCR